MCSCNGEGSVTTYSNDSCQYSKIPTQFVREVCLCMYNGESSLPLLEIKQLANNLNATIYPNHFI